MSTASTFNPSSIMISAVKALSPILDMFTAVLAKYPPLAKTHTKYGMGVRTAYPASPARDALKKGERSDPYQPVNYTADVVTTSIWAPGKPPAQSWADPENPEEIATQVAAGRKRVMPYGYSIANQPFEIVNGFPANPIGITGITGRGELGLWGANPAADPIIFRMVKDILCVLLIQRADGSKEWAFPGGMVDPTDPTISAAAVRELKEETGFSVTDLVKYSLGPVFSGYVDDSRNTDHAWMETNAFSWFLTDDVPSNKIKLFEGGDGEETLAVKWVPLTPELLEDGKLFASHGAILRDAVRKLINI
jgi:ADP-ribose pyrophosphatase